MQTLIALLFATAVSAAPPATLPAEVAPTADVLLDRLIQTPGQLQVLQTSSRNKLGRNGDANWPLYKDEHGDEVIFDAAGPGCVRSMWGTSLARDAVLKFYFDGEPAPRYRIGEIDFFAGKHPHFPAPLASYEERGHWGNNAFAGNCFVPIAFARSLKIAIAGKSEFFHILYELYPEGAPIATFTGRESNAALRESFDRGDSSPPHRAGDETISVETAGIEPGKAWPLLERKGAGGVVREIVLEADDTAALLEEAELIMRWDGHERDDVRAPVGLFWGCAQHSAEVTSLPITVRKLPGGRVRLGSAWPMPFWSDARIALRNASRKPLGPVKARLVVGPNEVPENRGTHFVTLYRKGETTYGRDWTLFDSPGTGWFVGVVQSMQTGHYCEGDEHFTIDKAVSPQINGTGSEDYYLGCFWPNMIYNSPFALCTSDIQAEGGGTQDGAYAIPSSYARFHLEAPIPFFRQIDARIEHGGLSDIRSNYRSLAFCYLRRRPGLRQTDFIDVGSAVGERAHGYTATASELTGPVTARPEGDHFDTAETADGRRHTGGEISFNVAIDPGNAGVRLRRRLDQGGGPQAAEVYVDGAFAGRWVYAYQNEHLRWFDSDFDIHPRHTRGKSALEVKLVVVSGPGWGVFTDFAYEVACLAE